jgi:hypothetical protein
MGEELKRWDKDYRGDWFTCTHGEWVLWIDASRLERERDEAVKWNEAVAVCKDHTADIVDLDGGRCVVCELADASAEIARLKAECDHRDEGIAAWREKCREAENEIARIYAEQAESKGE